MMAMTFLELVDKHWASFEMAGKALIFLVAIFIYFWFLRRIF